MLKEIVKYCEQHNYELCRVAKCFNIIYVEGMNLKGILSNDAPNEFNDLRIVVEFVNNTPKITGCWEATCNSTNIGSLKLVFSALERAH